MHDPVQQPDGRAGFLQQVEQGQRRARSRRRARRSTGEFKNEVKYPDDKAEPAKNFETEMPSFVIYNGSELQRAADATTRSTIAADADQRRARVLHEPDPRVRPGDPARVPVRLALAPGGGRADGRDRRVRALAGAPRRGQRHEGHVQRRRGHRRGQGRADRGRRLPQEPGEVPAARRPDPARRAARGPAGHGQDAARPRGRGRGGRAVLLASARPSSSRRSSASAPRACATSSSRPRRPRRRSSSSTSSTRSGAVALAAAARSAAATTSASRRSTRSSPRWTASSRATR